MGAVPKTSNAQDPRYTWDPDVETSALARALRAPLRVFGVGVNRHEGVVTRKVRQPFKQLVPDAGVVPGFGSPPTNATWVYLDDAELPVGWAGRPPPKAPNVGDRVRLHVSPMTGALVRTKVLKSG
ncbi:MAG: hypothetical protein R8G01_07030 [Ilumatobacteraceae bacterium]|nr:hypothetical protein [Ilumatobacteraceae bacterium]